MNSQMIIKIMPLSKIHWASWVIAFQNFQVPLCFRILKFENSERPGRWYMMLRFSLVDFDFREISSNIRALNNFDNITVLWDLLSNTLIID